MIEQNSKSVIAGATVGVGACLAALSFFSRTENGPIEVLNPDDQILQELKPPVTPDEAVELSKSSLPEVELAHEASANRMMPDQPSQLTEEKPSAQSKPKPPEPYQIKANLLNAAHRDFINCSTQDPEKLLNASLYLAQLSTLILAENLGQGMSKEAYLEQSKRLPAGHIASGSTLFGWLILNGEEWPVFSSLDQKKRELRISLREGRQASFSFSSNDRLALLELYEEAQKILDAQKILESSAR